MSPTELLNFYTHIPSFHDFSEVMQTQHFHEAPGDWVLIISDIKGSTKAIQEGRYRDVNMVGASVFTAVINVLPDLDIPFVFGGDGATLLIPPSAADIAITALKATQKMAKERFGFDLRVGLVPLAQMYRQNIRLLVAKYEVSPKNYLAMFRGGALTKAEELVKAADPSVQMIHFDKNEKDPNLTGLSCRWEPFANQKGMMLTLLVQARKSGEAEQKIYDKVIHMINTVMAGDLRGANPIAIANMRGRLIASHLKVELKMNSAPGLSRVLKQIQFYLESFLNYVIVKTNVRLGTFQASEYKKAITTNADYKKFDDVLRMVIDCTREQAEKIRRELQNYFELGEIFFGTNESSEALMTCYVAALTEGRHLHFVDGAQGGYALAAVQMKQQIRESKDSPEKYEILKLQNE